MFVTLSFILPDNLSSSGFTVAQIMAMYLFAKSTYAEPLNQHRARGGAFYSNWRAIGFGLLFMLAILAVLVPLALLFGLV
ncbi:hypothetical protein D9M68_682120 [compost metagenome]